MRAEREEAEAEEGRGGEGRGWGRRQERGGGMKRHLTKAEDQV